MPGWRELAGRGGGGRRRVIVRDDTWALGPAVQDAVAVETDVPRPASGLFR
ncbi:hypothetical protein ACVNF4_26860 [Streptomyces sp. S6]